MRKYDVDVGDKTMLWMGWCRCKGQIPFRLSSARLFADRRGNRDLGLLKPAVRLRLRRLHEGEEMADDDALYRKGMPIRREVLGPEYVDASIARADEFMMSFQRATTAWAWGWAWGDPTLDRKTRSLMNLAMLTALNRAPEIKLHVKGALNNGVTVEEIKTALLHATAYCGIPAGLDAFRAAHEVLVSEGALSKP